MKRIQNKLFSFLINVPPLHIRELHMNSNRIRREFVSFFVDNHDHTFVKSSPVVPFCDPTVPFVNAGMNQFKGIFLGQSQAPYKRVVNSQKCIRVGGKHNDLESVGGDGYHHTFFEMLGNWSFGDYFKEKACKMAWELLTGPYRLNPERLYVTYFGGDEELGIEPDLETKNIWQNIGVSPENILAYGPSENFWEMGPSGPCGPCTEIHFDHEANRRNASERVNQGFDDVVELWNLVFIQYHRSADGSLKKLPCFHVDTGMGLERLVAILQGKRSNYDTDLFTPLFKAIQKVSGVPAYTGGNGNMDVHYRILADHSRMITVALADGMFPNQNVKLRRIIRRALNIAENTFGCKKGLVTELSNHVANSLVEAYPELGAKLKEIQLMINHEEEVLKSIQKSVLVEWQSLLENHPALEELNLEMAPGIVGAFKELQNVSASNTKLVPPDLFFKLYDTFGLEMKTIEILCNYFKLRINPSDFHSLLKDTRRQSREMNQLGGGDSNVYATVVNYVREKDLQPTDDSFKYLYYKENDYVFLPLESQIKAIVCENQCVLQADSGHACDVILNRTNLYHEAGGQLGDNGYLILNGKHIYINKVTNIQGYLLHSIKLPDDCTLCVGDNVILEVIREKRLGCMRNHTATHIVNSSLHRILALTCQKSSQVSDSLLSFDFAIYGEEFGFNQVKNIEDIVQTVVSSAIPVSRETVNGQKLLEMYMANKITIVPGEVYPQDGIHIVEIVDNNFTSREACCGTHVLNTADIGDFCVTAVKSPSAGTRTLSAVTGSIAVDAKMRGTEILENVSKLKKSAYNIMENNLSTEEEVRSLIQLIQNKKQDLARIENKTLPYIIRVTCLEILEEISINLKHFGRKFFREGIEEEMLEVLQEINEPFLVHFLNSSSSHEDIPLQKATKLCPELPVLLIAGSGDTLKARCCVPKKYISENFNAQTWLEQVLSVFNAQGSVPRGQNSQEVFNMRKKYVKREKMPALINSAIISAKSFAKTALHNS